MKNATTLTYLLATLLGTSIIVENSDAQTRSARVMCETPLFQNWKEQQAKRLWSPDDETIQAERSGKVFSYNCFTLQEIDKFFELHEDRIENAHFYPILIDTYQEHMVAAKDDDC